MYTRRKTFLATQEGSLGLQGYTLFSFEEFMVFSLGKCTTDPGNNFDQCACGKIKP
jgi:hypothetical protein